MKKNYRIATSIVLSFAAIIGAGSLVLQSAQNPNTPKAGILSHLKPETKIEYSVFAEQGAPVTGQTITDDTGTLRIQDEKLSAMGQGPVTYDLSITPPQTSKTMNLRVVFDEKAGAISLNGQGLEKFSDVSLTQKSQTITAKTDWAGQFKKISLFDFKKLKSGRAQDFQLAFQGQHFDIGENVNNPYIVHIIFAPGGGRPPDHTWEEPDAAGRLRPNPENTIYYPNGSYKTDFEGIMYFETYCGSPELSICHNASMTQQIINIVENYVTALLKMTEQLTAVMVQHVQMIGSMIDAKAQLETEREIQALVANAHKTYHPSEQMCEFGTFVRSLADTEERIDYNKAAFNKAMMTTYTGLEDRSTSEGYATDIRSRINQFKTTYCDPADNNNGLRAFCGSGGSNAQRLNKDIDYLRTMDKTLTLNVDFTDGSTAEEEADIFALARNLYWPRALDAGTPEEMKEMYATFMGWRNLAAVSGVAHNSFAQIMAMKAQGDPNNPQDKGGYFMKALLRDLGITDGDKWLGKNPSYYAQMEVLTKKIYQDPDFYTNLYDKPDNVRRINVTLEAIKLMQGRDRYESSLRREMLASMLVEQAMAKRVTSTNALIESQAGK